MKKPELILPAGNYEKLIYAIAYGADAVYAGIPETSLRAKYNGFDVGLLKEAVDYCHRHQKKIYITTNVYAREDDIPRLSRHMAEIAESKPDAFIVSDPGIFRIVSSLKLHIPVHLSTQANTTNSESVKYWVDQGIQRIILARELGFSEIVRIRNHAPDVELEIFVHGALCISYSGRCLLSSYLTGRDANRGNCAGACRWRYFVVEESRRDDFFEIQEDTHGTYILNSKDLCLIDTLPRLKKIDIDGYKVEGRTKNTFYLALVAMSYRAVMDAEFDGTSSSILPHVSTLIKMPDNHGFTHSFMFNDGKVMQSYGDSDTRHQEVAGFIREFEEDMMSVEVKNPISVGDSLLGISPREIQPLTVKEIQLNGQYIKTAYGAQKHVVRVRVDRKLSDTGWEYGILATSTKVK